jgi:hypothetical protein
MKPYSVHYKSFRNFRRLLFTCLLLLALPACAQLETGSITGRVTDSSGAIIPGAQVTLVNIGTNLTLQGSSNSDGIFEFPALQPGKYSVTAQHKGFSVSITTLDLNVGDTAHADLSLTVGKESTTITVTENSALELQSAAVDYVVTRNEVLDLPLVGGNPYGLAGLSPGVNPLGAFGQGLDTIRGALQTVGNANFSTNGGIPGSNEILLDGVPITVCCNGQPALTPSVAIVDQLRVITSVPPSQYGRTSGGVLNFSTVSGQNRIHGQVYEFFENTHLHAATYFAKANQTIINPLHPTDFRSPLHYNQYGIGIGGPVVIPHIYNGRDKTFFFAGFAGVNSINGTYITTTVPTVLQRQGNFSESCALKPTVAGTLGTPTSCTNPNVDPASLIYDPTSAYPNRTAFPNNTLPYINPIAKNYLNFYPQPSNSSLQNNYNYEQDLMTVDRQLSLRIDHEFTPKQRILLRGTYDYDHYHVPDLFGQYGGFTSSHQNIAAVVGALQDTWVLTPNTVVTLQYGFAYQRNYSQPGDYGYTSASVGFTSNFTSIQPLPGAPAMAITDYATLGGYQILRDDKYTHALGANVISQKGPHTLTFGFDGRRFIYQNGDLADASGNFSYGSIFTQYPSATQSDQAGQTQYDSLASFELGYPASGNITAQGRVTENQYYYAIYLQDNWRATAKLTLNLGVRYDVEPGITEKHNHFADFAPNISNPVSAYVGEPVTGGLAFRGVNGNSRGAFAANWKQVSPRVGFAYAARPTTVIRGAYGFLYLPTTQRLYGSYNNAEGVTSSYLPYITNKDPVPVGSINNPYPNGISQIPNPSLGAAADLGTAVGGLNYNTPPTYNQQWHVNLQQAMTPTMTLSIFYVGSHAVKLPKNFFANNLLPQNFGPVCVTGTNCTATNNAVAVLEQAVQNPYYNVPGVANNGTFAAPTIENYYTLARYPQYVSVREDYVGQGSQSYNALQASLRQTWKNGSSLNVAYTWSKNLGDVDDLTTGFVDTGTPGYQNSYFPRQERSYATIDVPERVVIALVGRIPYGRGQRFGATIHPWQEALLGNWSVNGIATFQSGLPMSISEEGQGSFGGTRPNRVAGVQARTSGPITQRLGGQHSTNGYLNPLAFATTGAFQLGNITRLCGECRIQGQENLNASLLKNVALTRVFRFQFRFEMFNVFNKVQFGYPGAVVGSTTFGQITSQTNTPRTIQLGAKILW